MQMIKLTKPNLIVNHERLKLCFDTKSRITKKKTDKYPKITSRFKHIIMLKFSEKDQLLA